jgi:VWFA-related protein
LIIAIKNFRPEDQVLRPAAQLQDLPSANDIALMQAAGGSVGGKEPPLALAAAKETAELAVRDFVNLQAQYALERRTLITIDALQELSRMLGGLPGRKNVVWLTASLPFDLIPEDRSVSDEELTADLPSVQQKSAGAIASGSLASQQRGMHGQQIRDVESQLASAGIALYPVDLNGLISGMENSASSEGSGYRDSEVSDIASSRVSSLQATHGTMEEVAAQTGGKAYLNQNDIKDGIALAASDERASYALGYYPENKKWDGKLRNIKVKVSQGNTQLRYRKGYFAIEPGPMKDHNYEQDVIAALAVDAPATQVSFKAHAEPTDPGKIRVVFLVDAHTLTAEDFGDVKKVNVSFYATFWGASDKRLAGHSIKVDRSFDAATYQQIVDRGMMVPMDLDIPVGGTELRLAVLDNKTGFIGTVSGPLGQ